MSRATEALNALKTILADIDPAPQPTPVGIWIYPDDYASISTASFPFIVLSESIKQPANWSATNHRITSREWVIEIMVFLAQGPIEYPNAAAAAAELKTQPWADAIYQTLKDNRTLNGTVSKLGGLQDNFIMSDRAMHSQWNQQVYWSLVVEVSVTQEHE